jgi:hypothetical protein
MRRAATRHSARRVVRRVSRGCWTDALRCAVQNRRTLVLGKDREFSFDAVRHAARLPAPRRGPWPIPVTASAAPRRPDRSRPPTRVPPASLAPASVGPAAGLVWLRAAVRRVRARKPGRPGRCTGRRGSRRRSTQSLSSTSSTAASPVSGLAPATSALGPGSPLPRRRWDRAHPCHVGTGLGLTSAPSLPGVGSTAPHLHQDWGSPLPPYLRRDWSQPCAPSAPGQ